MLSITENQRIEREDGGEIGARCEYLYLQKFKNFRQLIVKRFGKPLWIQNMRVKVLIRQIWSAAIGGSKINPEFKYMSVQQNVNF